MQRLPLTSARALLLATCITALSIACTAIEPGAATSPSNAEPNATAGAIACAAGQCLDDDVRIAAQPATLWFSDVPVGQEQILELDVTNVGLRGVLSVHGGSFSPENTAFSLIDFTPLQLAVGATIRLKVRYRPALGSATETTLLLANNSSLPDQRPLAVPVRVDLAAGALVIEPNPVDFGVVGSQQSPTQVVYLHNVGSAPMHVTKVKLAPGCSAEFAILDAPGDEDQVGPAESLELTLGFSSSQLGIHLGQLIVTDSTGEVSTAQLRADKRAAIIAVSPSPLYFGKLLQGQSSTRQLSVTNSGNAPLHVHAVQLSADSVNKAFQFVPGSPLTVPPGAHTTIDVTGTAAQDWSNGAGPDATIEVLSDAENTPLVKVPAYLSPKPCYPKVTPFTVTQTKLTGGADIIWIVDTSKSMTAEVVAVQQGINAFSQFIKNKAVSSRVVMLAEASRICVPPPLGGPSCQDTATFKHVDVKIGSKDALTKIIDSYPKWKAMLAPVATRHFVLVSDDNSNAPASWFTKAVAELENPGFPQGFVFHSIVADGPLAEGGCSPGYARNGYGKKWGAKGEVYLELTKQTGGVATSICELTDWDKVFNAIAANVAASTIQLTCEHALPAMSAAETVSVQFDDAGGKAVTVPRVGGADSCPMTGLAWHFDSEKAPKTAKLCPATCEAKAGKQLRFLHGCP